MPGLSVRVEAGRALRGLRRIDRAVHTGTVRDLNNVAFGAMRFEGRRC